MVRKADPVVVSDPGITDANLQMVQVAIDGDDPVNQSPNPVIDDANIETLLLDIDRLQEQLDGTTCIHFHAAFTLLIEFIEKGLHVDSRLYHFAAGLTFARRYL